MRMACLISMVAFPVLAAGTPVATLSTNRIAVGDRVELVLTTRHAANERVLVPDITRPPYIISWETGSETKRISDQELETESRIVFSSFLTGEHRISTNNVSLLDTNGSEQFIPFPGLVIRVDSVLTNPPPSLSELKPPVGLPGLPWLRTLIVIFIVTIIAGLAAWFIRQHLKQRARKPASIRIIPPHEVALTALEALIKRQLIEQRAIEAFYIELSAIVRVYLEDRFNLRAPEQTTEEFIRTSAGSSALSSEHRALTQSFLEQSDLVKFARYEPESDDMRRAWDAAARLVRETIPATPTGAAS